jgi:hypothetical protein
VVVISLRGVNNDIEAKHSYNRRFIRGLDQIAHMSCDYVLLSVVVL